MANTLTNLIPTTYAALDVVSRELVGLIPSVSRDARADSVAINQTLYIPVAPTQTTASITPAMSIPSASDKTFSTKSITISKQKTTSFSWSGEEQYAMDKGPGYTNLLQDQLAQSMRVLVNEMESDLWTAGYGGSSRATGTAGTTPFDSTLGASADARKILADNGCPMSELSLVIDTAAGAKLRTLSQLTKANEAGSAMTLRDGELLNMQGFSVKESASVTTVTAGTGASYLLNGALAVGDTTVTVDTGSGTILAGDVVTIGSHKYVVASALSGGTFTINEPGIRAAAADNLAITVNSTSTRNLAFTRSALLLATRLPQIPAGGDLRLDSQVVTDPRSGISFEVSLWPGQRMNLVQVAACWGTLAVAPRHIATVLG